MCVSPITIKRDYRRTTPEVAQGYNTNTDVVPCGKCFECLARRRDSWAFRLWHQMQVSETAHFITLTYEDEPVTTNGHGTLRKKDVQDFMKRLRKRTRNKIKYYCCGEYGSLFKRPHYHLIIFNIPEILVSDSERFALDIWQLGQVDIANANIRTIAYTVGYVMKGLFTPEHEVDEDGVITCEDDRVPEYATMSKNLGISYLSDAIWDWHLNTMSSFARAQNGTLIALPRYYRDKIFSREEKKELAVEARKIRDFDFLQWDYQLEHERKKAAIRSHEKQQKLKRLKL